MAEQRVVLRMMTERLDLEPEDPAPEHAVQRNVTMIPRCCARDGGAARGAAHDDRAPRPRARRSCARARRASQRDDDPVARRARHRAAGLDTPRWRRAASAALLPFMPCTPAPGGVPAEQMNTPGMPVLYGLSAKRGLIRICFGV